MTLDNQPTVPIKASPFGPPSSITATMVRDHNLVMFDDPPHFCLPIRRRKFVVGFALSALSLLVPAYLYFSQFPLLVTRDTIFRSPGASTWNRTSALLGPPTDRFRGSSALTLQPHSSNESHVYSDNLRNDTKYITSWISAGWCWCLVLPDLWFVYLRLSIQPMMS